ncbi:MAG: nuoJ [Cyanobacteria bacterium RYN_339]|nr:nuoJ [Cyanobacteria bacterium RYN_339]
MQSIMFYLLSFLVVVSATTMIFQRHPLNAAFSLVLCFLGLAGLYAQLQAPLLAIFQVLVYAGAIMARVVFVIMLLNVRDEDLPSEPNLVRSVGIGLGTMAVLFFMILVPAINKYPNDMVESVPAKFGGIEWVGLHLFTRFTFPFEVISILLTVAVVGVVVLAKRRI